MLMARAGTRGGRSAYLGAKLEPPGKAARRRPALASHSDFREAPAPGARQLHQTRAREPRRLVGSSPFAAAGAPAAARQERRDVSPRAFLQHHEAPPPAI